MPAVAEQIAELLTAPEGADPADADALGDETVAGRKRGFSDAVRSASAAAPLPAEKRLRMRAAVPVLSKYRGKKVDRREAFAEQEEDSDEDSGPDMPAPPPDSGEEGSEDDGPSAAGLSGSAAAGGFSISGDLEAEYKKMMKQTSKELEVMRTPSTSEVTKRQEEAKRLKKQLDAWNSLVEFRIHLEGALSVGHRLPVGEVAAAFREADSSIASGGDAVAKELRDLLGELLALQGRLTEQDALSKCIAEADEEPPAGEGEPRAWSAVDGRLRRVLDWGLDVADDWKERTRLDTRRSFKVLDQSLRMQMQAVSEVAPEKLRKRCTPPPGRHKVFGLAQQPEAEELAEGEGGEGEIFDDRDFYVQLLREVLAAGGGGSKAGGLGDEAKELQMELQGRRAAKKKNRADVERRASKGRKIRYVPIEKLQNFMAPRPRGSTSSFALGGPGVSTEEQRPAFLQFDGAVDAMMRSLFAAA